MNHAFNILTEEICDINGKCLSFNSYLEKYPNKPNPAYIREKQNFRELLVRMRKSNEVDITKIEEKICPQQTFDVFISHSHKDEGLAITFSNFLSDVFYLRAFVDSRFWGNVNELQKEMNDIFSKNEEKVTCDCQKGNVPADHLRLMLANALGTMMDRTKCGFFLNTPNSISTENSIETTDSSWINFELNQLNILQKKKASKLKIIHRPDMTGLSKLNLNDILKWKERWENKFMNVDRYLSEDYKKEPGVALGYLYDIFPQKSITI